MKEHYYFDNAATTWPKPEVVYTFMDQFYRSHGVNPGRSGHTLSIEAEQMVVETRRMLGAFFNFGGDPNRVVFTQNATDSLNLALFGLLGVGDHVISTRLEHNSVRRPLNHLERDHGVLVTLVGRDAQGYVDPDEIRAAITPRTRVVVVNHASNVLGSLQDLEAIAAVVEPTDAILVVDTCQSAGVVPIDMDAIGIDILTFTGHKGLLGPMGIGGLIVREGIDLPPARFGGTGVDSMLSFQPDEYPNHLEAGTISIPGVAGLNAAQRWFAELGRECSGRPELDHGAACRIALEHVDARERDRVDRLAEAFRAISGVQVYGPTGNRPRVAVLSLNIEGVPAEQVGTMLDADYHVCVRPGLHCAPTVHEDEGTLEQLGSVRFSPGYFTDDEDMEQAIGAVQELAGQLVD